MKEPSDLHIFDPNIKNHIPSEISDTRANAMGLPLPRDVGELLARYLLQRA